jgi:hypothetical protein
MLPSEVLHRLKLEYTDSFGCITEKQSQDYDGGDSAHRFGITVTCLKLLDEEALADNLYRTSMNKYEVSPGVFCRHPDSDKWYSDPRNLSRDQLSMLVLAMLSMNDTKRMSDTLDRLKERNYLMQNKYPNFTDPRVEVVKPKFPDVPTPSFIACFYPKFHKFTDWFFILDILFAAYDDMKCKRNGTRTDYWTMLVMQMCMATWTSPARNLPLKLASRLIGAFDYKGAIRDVFGPRWASPPLYELIIPVCERYL